MCSQLSETPPTITGPTVTVDGANSFDIEGFLADIPMKIYAIAGGAVLSFVVLMVLVNKKK